MERIDFELAKKELPIDRGELAKRIANTPIDVILEYIDGMKKMKGNIEQFISVFSAANGPCCEGLLEQIPDERLGDLELITEYLSDQDVLSQVDNLIKASFGNTKEAGSPEKVNQVLEMIGKLDQIGLEKIGSFYWATHRDIDDFFRMLVFYLQQKRDPDALKRYLGCISNERLDVMILTATNGLKIFEEHF